MIKLKPLTVEQQLRNAMAAAQWRGCDPYDSHTAQSQEWQRIARVRAGLRSRSEAQANRELAREKQRGVIWDYWND